MSVSGHYLGENRGSLGYLTAETAERSSAALTDLTLPPPPNHFANLIADQHVMPTTIISYTGDNQIPPLQISADQQSKTTFLS